MLLRKVQSPIARTPQSVTPAVASWRALPTHPRRPHIAAASTDGKDEAASSSGGSGSDLESAFAKELRRREEMKKAGDAPQAAEGAAAAAPKDPFAKTTTRTRAAPPPKAYGGWVPESAEQEGQRERSQAMVNEGLEGLLPRASRLLQLGASIFLGFLPFMVVISLLFSGVYAVFGDSFVHRGQANTGPRPYIDAERLLSESTVDPYVPFDRP